jgi:hypothetical protein
VRRWRVSDLRLVTCGTFRRMRPGDIRRRIARLRDVLENLEAWTVRMLKRFLRGFDASHCILAAPPAFRAAPAAPGSAAAYADTS